jgi:hypothetical protein
VVVLPLKVLLGEFCEFRDPEAGVKESPDEEPLGVAPDSRVAELNLGKQEIGNAAPGKSLSTLPGVDMELAIQAISVTKSSKMILQKHVISFPPYFRCL